MLWKASHDCFCLVALGSPNAGPVTRAHWDSYLLTLNLHGYVYFHLKVNIQRLVVQYICLNTEVGVVQGEKSKASLKLVTFTF